MFFWSPVRLLFLRKLTSTLVDDFTLYNMFVLSVALYGTLLYIYNYLNHARRRLSGHSRKRLLFSCFSLCGQQLVQHQYFSSADIFVTAVTIEGKQHDYVLEIAVMCITEGHWYHSIDVTGNRARVFHLVVSRKCHHLTIGSATVSFWSLVCWL